MGVLDKDGDRSYVRIYKDLLCCQQVQEHKSFQECRAHIKCNTVKRFVLLKMNSWTSLVVQWLGIHLLMQGTQVPFLVREDSTCCGATKPLHHNDSTHILEPASHNCCGLHTLELVLDDQRSHCNEKHSHHNQRVVPTRYSQRKPVSSNKDPIAKK